MSKKIISYNNKIYEGIIKRHPDGFGFFVPDDSTAPDVYISREEMDTVMTNDRVKVRYQLEKSGKRYRGKILEMLQRSTKSVSGRFHKISDLQGVLPDEGLGWGEDVKVAVPPGMEVDDGDWVVVELTSFPDSIRGLAGNIKAVVGDPGDPLKDNIRILHAHEIPVEFSKDCKRESEGFPTEVSEEEIKDGRRDLTALNFITIDGQTAKDFDDAILVTQRDTGFNLKVAIADVSHYVKLGTAIDKDAVERGNSTYLPNFVAPMLPEALSNELCSLKPNVKRLALVADLDFDFSGEKQRAEFYEAVIESKARVTYGQAQQIIDGSIPEGLEHVAKDIITAEGLAKILMARRFKLGSLDLDIPETTVELDETGVPTDIIKAARLFAHRLIEEMMLAANVAVAEFITEKEMPGLFRVHEAPKSDDIDLLQSYLENFGYSQSLRGGKLQKKLTKALQEFSGTAQEPIINILTLRSMSQAKYDVGNIGHFGLGFDNYVHFTSPIRRYPDLVIHRILKSLVTDKSYKGYSEEELATLGTMLSACEQRSVKAERQLIAIKKARFVEGLVGSEFEGMVTSVTKFGLFVVLRQYDVDGLVRLEDLPGDRYIFDDEHLLLVGKKSGRSFGVGDNFKIIVAGVDVEEGKIDFVPSEGVEERATDKKTTDKSAKKRGKTKKNSKRVRKARVSKSRGKGKSR